MTMQAKTCKPGQEQAETFRSRVDDKRWVQYDFSEKEML
jgi:hypothetical protein